MASPEKLREVRFQVGTTHRTTQLNAGADGDWNVSNSVIHKLRVTSIDTSGLTQPGIPDETVQTRMHAQPPAIAGLRKGAFKIQTYAGGAYANRATPEEWNIAHAMAGGLNIPSNRSALAVSGVSTINVECTAIGTSLGIGRSMGVLVGTRGDGRGNGEVKPINAISANHLEMSIATSAAVSAGDALVFGDDLYPDEDATQKYLDVLAIGHASADQIQAIGCAGGFALTGTAIGEVPKLDFDPTSTDWEYCPSGSRASMQHGTPARGGTPAFDKGVGLAHIGDKDSNTRVTYKVTDVAFNPGLAYDEIPSVSGTNGVGGMQHMPGVPSLECTILTGDDDGLLDDFPSTAKTVLIQMGHQATRCIAVFLREAYLDDKPARVAVGNLTGWKLKFHGTEDYVANNDQQSAAWHIWVF